MIYTLKGNLTGVQCDDHFMPLSNTTVRLYRSRADVNEATVLVAAQAKETFQIIDEKGIKSKEKDLLAESKTDESGNYTFEINGDKAKYKGEAVEFAVFYAEVPDYGQKNTEKPKNFQPFLASLNVLQPKWRETNNGLQANWNYRISNRIWCQILSILDIWLICGLVSHCESQQALAGIEVIAMDDDVISDDQLGSAITDENGRFCIYYRSKDFKKTFLSPVVNVETPLFPWGNGPDIFFKFAFGGSIFFEELPSRARQADRENVGNCFCVRLCLRDQPDGGNGTGPIGYFFAIGELRRYNSIVNINPASGKTVGKPISSWNDLAFYQNLALVGALTEKLNGAPMEYKFQYTELTSPGDPVPISPGAWTDVIPTQIANTVIGYGWKLTPGFEYEDIAINAVGSQIPVSFNGNWIVVPQSGSLPMGFNLVLNNNGPLIKLISSTIAGTPVDMGGLIPGNSTTSVNPLQQNRYFSLRMIKREAGNPSTEVVAGVSRPLAIFNTKYLNVPQRGSWLPTTNSNELGVASIDLDELATSGGCSTITNTLTAKYTAANPNLGAVSLNMTGPGGPHSFAPVVETTPGEESHGTSAYTGSVEALPKCSYEVRLSAELKLTNGESQHDGIWDRVLFCK
ncbi:hypothetical protein [Cyclobacterium jeungdonense]|uniref:Carboxypeptidase regulatory-like domain-containing protein n=1 Tax=Cyclobacterium jeungdonense TaxID=708087 RepID=A0ABT8CBA9_9BACT|nr:hypothetical protein [Cyclobacterium jeungdonense]MDN3690084.1 hypothetical protein [Cyclobacterium jeungdonense]